MKRAFAVENDLFCEIDMSLRSGGFGEQIVAHNVLLAVAHAEKFSTAPICSKRYVVIYMHTKI